jgi:hypothetical protein
LEHNRGHDPCGKSGHAAIVAGASQRSELVRRITSRDAMKPSAVIAARQQKPCAGFSRGYRRRQFGGTVDFHVGSARMVRGGEKY